MAMKLISHISQIDPSLEQKNFWTFERLQIMGVLDQYADGKQELTRKTLNRAAPALITCLNQVVEERPPQRNLSEAQKTEINTVLSLLEERGWRVLYYPLKLKKPRRSVVPTSAAELISWRNVEQWRQQFWHNTTVPLTEPAVALALIIEIDHSIGVNHRLLKKQALTALTLDSAESGLIHLPLERARTDCALSLPLNARARLLWAWYLRHVAQPIESWRVRIKGVRELLKQIPTTLQEQSPSTRLNRKVDHLLKAGSYSLADQGIEPFIIGVLQSDFLPLPPPNLTGSFGFYPVDGWPWLVQRTRPTNSLPIPSEEVSTSSRQFEWDMKTNHPDITRDSLLMNAEVLESMGWLAACHRAAQRLTSALRQACIDETGHYRNQVLPKNTVLQILEQLKADAIGWLRWRTENSAGVPSETNAIPTHIDLLERSFTALDLMIAWAYRRLLDDQVTASTLANDLRLVFVRGFFWYPGSATLNDWDDEDVELLIADHLLIENSRKGSQRAAVNLLKRIGEWSRSEFGCFTGVFFPSASGSGTRVTWRNHVIGLEEFDLLQSKLDSQPITDRDQVQAVLDLGFYGGLRSGEIANLRLGHIVSGRDELVLYLPAFKTPSARRTIQFHLLAPPEAVARVRTVFDKRMIAHRKYLQSQRGKKHKLLRDKTLLFSNDGRIAQASAIELIAYAREILKEWLGDGADLHLCRHSFASHLLLRWYCSRHPELIEVLREENHFAFGRKGIENLKRYLGEHSSVEQAAQQPSSLIHLIKIMGHRTTHTLFAVYVHSFEVIANHALRQAHIIDDKVTLTSHMITELVPGMRSRASQRSQKGRNASVLLERIVASCTRKG